MFFALALLLIHPQLANTISSLSVNDGAIDSRAAVSAPATPANADNNSQPATTASLDSSDTAAQPAVEPAAVLPDAPVAIATLNPPAPMPFLNPAKPLTVSIDELRAENRRKQLVWKGLIIASSGAATFDAWTTRRAITMTGAVELNPLLKPFSGNGSLYAAVQVGPALLDFAGKKMMYNRHSWVRRMWWVPQSASFVTSMFCGAHNLAYH